MEIAISFLQGASYVLLAVALSGPLARRTAWRRSATIVVCLAAIASLAHGLLGPEQRELTTIHTFVGYEGLNQETSAVHFETGTKSAAGYLWPLPFLGFALVGLALLRWTRDRLPRSPWVLPCLFAWSGITSWLLMQQFAAPAALVQPWGLPRILWPACLLLTFELARSNDRLLSMLAQLCVGIVALRLPVALVSKYLSDNELGTSLDVHRVTDFVHPFTQLQFMPKLTEHSSEQQFWLIWAEHVIMFPALYLMSMAGIAFCVFMIRKHDRMTD